MPDSCSATTVYRKYLDGINQLSFKLGVIMPKGMEFLNSYATIDGSNYGIYAGDPTNKTIWLKLNNVDNISPLSLTAIEFLREQLPGQAFTGYDVLETTGLAQVAIMLAGLFQGLRSAFKNPVKSLRQQGKAQTVNVSKCFVRLNDPDGFKYGGGYRVKSIKLKDNWREMNGGQLYTSEYGQDYDYTTKEVFNGIERTISSGVASYEPSLGGDENPFQTMVQISNKVPLGPSSYGAVEMPVLDAFFPSASVGYSKVTVKTIKKGPQDPTKKSRSGIGKQVTEYYTAKDFPVYYSNTSFDPSTDKQGKAKTFAFFYKYAIDTRTLSQGFLVETNDMHVKMKSQSSYPENDDKTPVNYTQNFYRNTGSNGFSEKFDFVSSAQSGAISQGNMGIDVELLTDTREFSVKSNSLEIQGQLDLFPVILPFWLPFIWPVVGNSENTYRAVTATKVVTYHSILDSVLVIDKGSVVSTKNMVFDAETGDVIVNRTNNEFKQPVYSTSYPAWWAYSGMGPAYKNIDAIYTANFRDGVINIPTANFESGDELYLINQGTASSDPCASSFNNASADVLWAFDKNKNTSSLTNPAPSFLFMDKDGKFYSKNNVRFRIIRSGKRNMLDAKAGSTVTMKTPVLEISPGNKKLNIDANSNTINATAVEFKEKWQTDKDVFKRYNTIPISGTCTTYDVENCTGETLERNINPYRKGLLGNFRTYQSKVFYGNRGSSAENSLVAPINTNLPANGYLRNFKLYWDFNNLNNLVPDVASTQWVWNSQISKVNAKGLELETKNALGIYTAAQYGYNKTMPVAIANNSRSNEMFAEGFEDKDYNESINQGVVFNSCTNNKHIDFSIAGTIINANDLGIVAHTGKNVLKINPNSTGTKSDIAVNPLISLSQDFTFQYAMGSYALPVSGGGNVISRVTTNPVMTQSALNQRCTTNFGNTSMFCTQIWNSNTNQSNLTFDEKSVQYVRAPQTGNYTFNLQTAVSSAPLSGNQEELRSGLYLILTNIETGEQRNMQVNFCSLCGSSNPTQTYSFYLNCGNYKIESFGYAAYFNTEGHSLNSSFAYTTSGGLITTAMACSFTKPIPATEQMLNPVFSPVSGEKMLFSAWVRENCTAPCTVQNYANSKIELDFGGAAAAVTLLPTGNIIEGWQKIEGEFTVPSNATTMSMHLVNNGGSANYWDDIRIQPYNANMKSYVYDPVNLRLLAELDANNYARFYEYDAEGTLIRTKVETKEGIKTVTETRSAKQKNITTVQ